MNTSSSENQTPNQDNGNADRVWDFWTPREAPDPGSYREVLRIAIPLVLSTASLTVNLFVDRLFLSWYGQASVAAATPGAITYFTTCSFFMGTAQYVNTIVAQYHGAGDKPACARAVWQGIFFSLMAAPLILACIPLGFLVFSWSGHAPDLMQLEKDYFLSLMLGGINLPINSALSSFFSGRGRTSVVLLATATSSATNMVLDYLLIFGKLGLPEMGIRGAGIATSLSGVIPLVILGSIFLSARYQPEYRSRKERKWDPRLFRMLLRYGIPSGIALFLDVAAYTLFVLLVGRLGEADLAASNIVANLEMLSFLPMVGMSVATATLVGRYIGKDRPLLAEKSVRSALTLAIGYMGFTAVIFVCFPQPLIGLFRSEAHSASGFQEILVRGVILLRIAASYTLFDTMFIIYSGALKGAGDTRFAMWMQILVAWIVFIPPVYLIIERFQGGLVAAWLWWLVYAVVLGVVFWLRFRSGYWKGIQMIRTSTLPTLAGDTVGKT